MWIKLFSYLSTLSLQYTCLTWEHLGATSGLVFYFWGQLDSFFTVALIKQLACTAPSWVKLDASFSCKGKLYDLRDCAMTGKLPSPSLSWSLNLREWNLHCNHHKAWHIILQCQAVMLVMMNLYSSIYSDFPISTSFLNFIERDLNLLLFHPAVTKTRTGLTCVTRMRAVGLTNNVHSIQCI